MRWPIARVSACRLSTNQVNVAMHLTRRTGLCHLGQLRRSGCRCGRCCARRGGRAPGGSLGGGRGPGSRTAARLRPPPAAARGPAPESSSSAPSDTVACRTPAARATSRIPPCPTARASAPISSRRCRSSRCGKIVPNFATNLAGYHHVAYTTPACRIPGSYGLFSGKP